MDDDTQDLIPTSSQQTEEVYENELPTGEELLEAITLVEAESVGDGPPSLDIFEDTDLSLSRKNQPFDSLEPHGLDIYPTMLKNVDLDDQGRPMLVNGEDEILPGRQELIGVAEIFRNVSKVS